MLTRRKIWRSKKMPRRKRLEAGAGADVWAVGDGVIAVAIFARQVQVTVAGLDAKRTHNGPAGADVGFLVAINAAGERIRRVVIIAVQAEAVADFPLQAAADRGRITFIALFRIGVNTFTTHGREERPQQNIESQA